MTVSGNIIAEVIAMVLAVCLGGLLESNSHKSKHVETSRLFEASLKTHSGTRASGKKDK
jgi:hypothetical protein